MTGYTVHTGTSEKFAAGWDLIFSGAKPAKKAGAKARKKEAKASKSGSKKKKKSGKVKRGK